MYKVMYIPLDERPCNNVVPQMLASVQKDKFKVISVPNELLGHKKKPAQVINLQKWILDNINDLDAVILSLEMIVYGGLLPSRLHDMELETGLERLNIINKIKEINPKIKIYLSNLIMRTPKYSSSDEEPDYYENFGREIFLKAYLNDKKNRIGLSNDESKELQEIEKLKLSDYINDYETRRAFNISLTCEAIKLLKNKSIDYMVIPQDDSAPFGYTALDQQRVKKALDDACLTNEIMIYPGADEVGATLLARTYCDLTNINPLFYPIFPGVNSAGIIPLYEDRPLSESMKSHIYSAGGKLAFDVASSDIIIGYNTAGLVMEEASQQVNGSDITYSTYRNLDVMVRQLKDLQQQGKAICIADSAYANGGDLTFIKYLDKEGILEEVLSYKGWNTNCNTLGTTLAAGIFAYNAKDKQGIKDNIIYHLCDDVFYQSIIRSDMNLNYLEKYDGNYFDISKNNNEIIKLIDEKIITEYNKYIIHSFKDVETIIPNSYSPWLRMFEIGLNIRIKREI